MRVLRSGHFWGGVLAAYVVLAVFPQFLISVRGFGAKATLGRNG